MTGESRAGKSNLSRLRKLEVLEFPSAENLPQMPNSGDIWVGGQKVTLGVVPLQR